MRFATGSSKNAQLIAGKSQHNQLSMGDCRPAVTEPLVTHGRLRHGPVLLTGTGIFSVLCTTTGTGTRLLYLITWNGGRFNGLNQPFDYWDIDINTQDIVGIVDAIQVKSVNHQCDLGLSDNEVYHGIPKTHQM